MSHASLPGGLVIAGAHLIALLGSVQAAQAGKDQEALVVAVPWGNSFLARVGHRELIVALIGLDTTGEEEEGEKVLFLGNEPREFLERLVLGKKVILRKERGYPKPGMKFSRNAHVYLPDGTAVSAEIIREGYGHARSDPAHAATEQFRSYEREARERRAGLWSTLPPVGGAGADAPEAGEIVVRGSPLGARECKFTHPEIIKGSQVQPQYPPLALQQQIGAVVILDAVVNSRGEVVRLQPVRRVTGDSGFEKAAMEAVKQWKYVPATLDGVPVASALTVFVDFSLK